MLLAEYVIIGGLAEESEQELLEVAKSLAKQTKYVVIECVSDLYDLSYGITNLKSVMNVLDTNETGNIHSKLALVMGEDLEENHIKINVKFYDEEPSFTDNIYN